jgi:hypothetical protein
MAGETAAADREMVTLVGRRILREKLILEEGED